MSGSISSKSIGNNASTSHSGGHASQPPPANNPWHFGLKLPSLWTWFEGHYGLVLLGVVVATLFGILYWHLTRIESEQERTRKFIQKGGRIVVIVSAFLGIVVGSQIGSIADLQIPSSLWILAGLLAMTRAGQYFWTITILGFRVKALLLKGDSVNNDLLYEENAIRNEIRDVEAEFVRVIGSILPRAASDKFNQKKSSFGNSPLMVLLVTVGGFITELHEGCKSEKVWIHGATDVNGNVPYKTADIPDIFKNLPEAARKKQGAVAAETKDVWAVACPVEYQNAEIVAVLWSNKSMDSIRTAQMWSMLQTFMETN